jgi:hypothetical protein
VTDNDCALDGADGVDVVDGVDGIDGVDGVASIMFYCIASYLISPYLSNKTW